VSCLAGELRALPEDNNKFDNVKPARASSGHLRRPLWPSAVDPESAASSVRGPQTSSAAMRGPRARLNATAVQVDQVIASGHEPWSENWMGSERIALNFLSGTS
jgi:hypothetical protein